MKRLIKPMLFLLMFSLAALPGCSSQVPSKESKADISMGRAQDNKNTYIDPSDVEWMKMQGGLHITTKALFSENASDKISKIISLINRGTGKMVSTEEEIGVIHSKARPVGIAIKVKDEDLVYIWPSYQTTSWENGWSAAPRTDRFVLNVVKNGKDEYFTILSNDAANYLREGWRRDMPMVEPVTVSPSQVKAGERVVLAGDGCTENEVSIYIDKGGSEKKYLIAKVNPVFGVWKWEGTISRDIRTLDGQKITLEKSSYGFTVSMGEVNIGSGRIDFTN